MKEKDNSISTTPETTNYPHEDKHKYVQKYVYLAQFACYEFMIWCLTENHVRVWSARVWWVLSACRQVPGGGGWRGAQEGAEGGFPYLWQGPAGLHHNRWVWHDGDMENELMNESREFIEVAKHPDDGMSS